jgi:hypothetical protein
MVWFGKYLWKMKYLGRFQSEVAVAHAYDAAAVALFDE